MTPHRLLLLMLLAFAAGLAAEDEATLPPGGKAQTKGGISAALSTRLLFPRSQAPLPISTTLANDSDTPRSGMLHLTLVDGNEVLYSWQSPEWTLTRSPRTVDVLLPPLPLDESHGEVEARLEWREGASRTAFDPLPLIGPGRDERPLTVALFSSAGVDGRSLLRSASLERFLAVPGNADWKPDARTVPVRLGDGDLPTHPLGYCAYDEVILAGEGIARLKEKQLAALERWVRAGGSLYIVPEGPLGEDAAAFLKRLGADDGEALVDARGKLVETGEWPRLLRPGLGRAAVAPIEAALDPARATDFAALPAHLWKLRAEPARLAAAGKGADFGALGRLDRETREHELQGTYYNGNPHVKAGEERPSFQRVRVPLTGALTNLLLPSHVTIIPFSVVLLVFAAFVLLVGPGDWFVLGWLRARRFTWVVFPLVAIAFTLLMVRLSRHYLGATDHRQRLEVVDCGAGGEVLRASAIELVFSGHRGELANELHDALWADMGRGETDTGYAGYRQQRPGQEVDAAPSYDGSLPGRYVVAQQIGQWDPRLRRSLSFDAPAGLPLRLDRQLRIDELPAYAEQLARDHGPLYVAYWRSGSLVAVRGSLEDLSERGREFGAGQRDWLSTLCCHPQAGWFTLAAQVSPCGGATFEDFSLADASDPDQWLLVVAQRKGDEVWVVRRLFRDDGKGRQP